jgi:ribosomal protein S25
VASKVSVAIVSRLRRFTRFSRACTHALPSQASDAPKGGDKKKGGKAADKKKKVKKVEKPAIHDYKRVDRKKAAQIKAQQTKQRALAVARVIAQARISFARRVLCCGGPFFTLAVFFACDCYLHLQIGTA